MTSFLLVSASIAPGFSLVQVLISLMGTSLITLILGFFLGGFFRAVQDVSTASTAKLSFFMAHDRCVSLIRNELRQDPLFVVTSTTLAWHSPRGACLLWLQGERLLLRRGKQVRTLAHNITRFAVSRQSLDKKVDLVIFLLETQIGEKNFLQERSVRIEHE